MRTCFKEKVAVDTSYGAYGRARHTHVDKRQWFASLAVGYDSAYAGNLCISHSSAQEQESQYGKVKSKRYR